MLSESRIKRVVDKLLGRVVESLEVTSRGTYVWDGGIKRLAEPTDWQPYDSVNAMKAEIEKEIGDTVSLRKTTPQTTLFMIDDETLGIYDHDSGEGIVSVSE